MDFEPELALDLFPSQKCTVGCPVLDRFLHGGVPCNSITELVSESGCGKTQFCLQLLLCAQLPISHGGLNSSSFYIHTEFPFPYRRLQQLSHSFFLRFSPNPQHFSSTPQQLDPNPRNIAQQIDRNPSIVLQRIDQNPRITPQQIDRNPKFVTKHIDRDTSIILQQIDEHPRFVGEQIDVNHRIITQQIDENARFDKEQIDRNPRLCSEQMDRNNRIITQKIDENPRFVSKQNQGNPQGNPWIVSEQTNQDSRIVAQQFDQNPGIVSHHPCDNIFVQGVHTAEELLKLLDRMELLLSRPLPFPVKLVVIDSVAALFRSEFDNSLADLRRRSSLFFAIAGKLKSQAKRFGLAIVVTNQVVDLIDSDGLNALQIGNFSFLNSSGRRVCPALGLSWSNCVNSRLFLSRNDETVNREADSKGLGLGLGFRTRRKLQVVFAPHLPESCCEFVVTRDGVHGVSL